MLTELQTRLIPYEQIEVAFARNRPLSERPLIPEIGNKVYYRREYWDQSPVLATVVGVQDPGDRSDPNLWQLVRDSYGGKPVYDSFGQVQHVPAPDPWPELTLKFFERDDEREERPRYAVTREARLRGSPGWLPLNWQRRPVRLPAELHWIPRPPLQPAHTMLEFGG